MVKRQFRRLRRRQQDADPATVVADVINPLAADHGLKKTEEIQDEPSNHSPQKRRETHALRYQT